MGQDQGLFLGREAQGEIGGQHHPRRQGADHGGTDAGMLGMEQVVFAAQAAQRLEEPALALGLDADGQQGDQGPGNDQEVSQVVRIGD